MGEKFLQLIQRNKFPNSILLKEPKISESSLDYRNHAFYYLLSKIRPRIGKPNTVVRDAVREEKRLSATLVGFQ